jgi:serine protease Do
MTDRSLQPPAHTYSPQASPRPAWAREPTDPAWSSQTPARWLEPLPQQAPPGGGRSGPGIGLLIVVALLAGALGSGLTWLGLGAAGRLDLGAAAVTSPSPSAPSTSATPLRPADGDPVIAAASAVSPAVVTITSTTAGNPNDPFNLPATGVGSGVIFDAAGWILTNRHVVSDAKTVSVDLADGRHGLKGSVYGIDTLTDLAIVKIDAANLPVAQLGDSSTLRPGELAIAIGSPLGTLTNSVTSGVISALGRQVTVTDPVTGRRESLRNLIQTDAAINPGNSGGALVNGAGQVVGINTAVAGGAQGIGFAIPINIAKPITRQAIAGQPLSRPWIGIVYVPVDQQTAEEHNLSIDYGAYISPPDSGGPAVQAGSPAEQAGLQEGDVLTAIDGVQINSTHGLDDILSQYEPGDTIMITLLRNGTVMTVSLTLGTRPAGLE